MNVDDLTNPIAAAEGSVVVLVAGAVTAGPVGGVPETVALFTKVPAFTSLAVKT